MNLDVDHYPTWSGSVRVTIGNGAHGYTLTRDEARQLRDDLTKALEEITQDEEQEP